MSFDRSQQSNRETYSERTVAAHHASRIMSDEAHLQHLDFRPSYDRELSRNGSPVQHAVYRPMEDATELLRAARHSRRDQDTLRYAEFHGGNPYERPRHAETPGGRYHDRSRHSEHPGRYNRREYGREMDSLFGEIGHAAKIVQNAFESIGEKLWARTKFKHVVQNGNLGCAAAVSECLNRSGFEYANSAGVGGLVDQLMKRGWTKHPISEARPGDVIYGHRGSGWRNGGGNAHIGIMGENGTAFGNSSSSGQWKHAPLEGIIGSRRFGQNRYCLRPPGGNEGVRDPRELIDARPPMNARRPPNEGLPLGPRSALDMPMDSYPPLDTRQQYRQQPSPIDGRRPPLNRAENDCISAVMDGRTSATEKLAAVQQLSHQGVSQFRFQGADGQTYSMRTETQSVGNREMVHLFITLPDGKERVVLRGIATGDGSFEREKSSNGRSVDFYGKGAGTVYGGESTSERADLYQFDGGRRDPRRLRDRDQNTGNGALDLYQFDGDKRNSATLETRRTPPSDSRPQQSMYERYRREEEGRERDQRNPFGDSVPDYGNQASINKIMDDAQRVANNSVNQLIRTPQGVYMRARMDIDADGSPRARQIDPTGQTQTSMRYTDGSSVNAEEVPYMVLPGGQYSQFGIKLGDMCLVRNKENGKVTVAVFADVGPRHKRGEGSMKLAEELGINPSPTRGGISRPNIEYLVLPGSGYPAQNQRQLLARIDSQKQRLGIR